MRTRSEGPDSVSVGGGRRLAGTVRTPGDKSISHRAVLLAALAEGTSTIRGLSDGEDVRHTVAAVAALGATVERDGDVLVVTGGPSSLVAPRLPVDCGNSGTGLRLLAGVAAGLPGTTVLVGDRSLSSRPMDRIAEPLRLMGATVSGEGERCLPPLSVTGGRLRGITWAPEVASAQVKSAILLAGLGATGPTTVREAIKTRAHTEEMMAEAGAVITIDDQGQGRVVYLEPSRLSPRDWTVPGDPSQAAFWLVAACLVPKSRVRVAACYGGAERIGFLGVLRRMGADVTVEPSAGEPGLVDLIARSSSLKGTDVAAAEIPSLDEVPVLAVAAAGASGTTVFHDVGELRVKESDRLAAAAGLVRALGATAEVAGDDLIVHGIGGRPFRHTKTDSGGDHRMAMAAAVGALAADEGASEVLGFSSVATSYPGFLDELDRLTAQRDAVGGAGRIVAIDGPAGSGKSTVSTAVAARLGVDRLDTGAMYRAVAWAALERGVDPGDAEAVSEIARDAAFVVRPGAVEIDGTDITAAIRSPEVGRAVSLVAAIPGVRRHLVERQRKWAAEHGGGVVEGRDIGSVVFPDAALKVFLTASVDERARRRADERAEDVARRDAIDSTRAASPLTCAPDAVRIDTTGRSVDDVVEEVLGWL